MPRKPLEEKLTPNELAYLQSLRLSGKQPDEYEPDELLYLHRLVTAKRVSIKQLAEFLGVDYNRLYRRLRSIKDIFKKAEKMEEQIAEDALRQAQAKEINRIVEESLREGKMPRRRKSEEDLVLEELSAIEASRKPGPSELAVLKTISAEVANDATARAKLFYELGKQVFSELILEGFRKDPRLVELAKHIGIVQAAMEYVKRAINAYAKLDRVLEESRSLIQELVDIINRQNNLIEILWRKASPFIKFEVESKLLLELLDRMLLARALGIKFPRNLPKLLKSYADQKFIEAVETWLKQQKET